MIIRTTLRPARRECQLCGGKESAKGRDKKIVHREGCRHAVPDARVTRSQRGAPPDEVKAWIGFPAKI